MAAHLQLRWKVHGAKRRPPYLKPLRAKLRQPRLVDIKGFANAVTLVNVYKPHLFYP